VLIVDDHPTFRTFARRVLEEAGFAVVGEASDCHTAVEAVQGLKPEVVLLDVLLPDGSGLDVATQLGRADDAPTVVLTSSRTAGDLGRALREAPAHGFITKAEFSAPRFASLLESR
jgi:DNA-binding NarL/FixJ family response regulator